MGGRSPDGGTDGSIGGLGILDLFVRQCDSATVEWAYGRGRARTDGGREVGGLQAARAVSQKEKEKLRKKKKRGS